jgi:hypothetical protein
MARRTRSLFQLPLDAMRLGIEAQSVIALRMMKVAAGGPAAQREINLMVAEKTRAAVDVQLEAGLSVLSGKAHLAPARTVALYRRRVRANQRRLTKGL